jgi:hypothetical protein
MVRNACFLEYMANFLNGLFNPYHHLIWIRLKPRTLLTMSAGLLDLWVGLLQ